jgi:hypothetical protein
MTDAKTVAEVVRTDSGHAGSTDEPSLDDHPSMMEA